MNRFDKQTVLVTGGSSGIGLGSCQGIRQGRRARHHHWPR
jgi:NAD(P)-dependent dehydrogenase (short-subunit alcohol dehydrogenase family)